MKTIVLHWEVDGHIETFIVPETDTINIGRSAQDCLIVLSSMSVSRKHASIAKQGDIFCLRNLSQKNRIQVNDRLFLAPGQETSIQVGDIFHVGPVAFRVVAGQDHAHDDLKIVCPTCKRQQDYQPQEFCRWCGTHLSTGETIIAGQE